jgi:hypothetical protein
MAKRIEQSRRHGHFDPRWTDRLHLVAENDATVVVDELELLIDLPIPRLTLVGGSAIEEDEAAAATPS